MRSKLWLALLCLAASGALVPASAQSDPGCLYSADFSGVFVTQPAGIFLNNQGVSEIYYPFETPDWVQITGSAAHNGDDLYAKDWKKNSSSSASTGQNAYAAISGVVACAVSLQPGLFGNTVVIYDPTSGFALRYAHLQALNPSIRPGDVVVAGQTLIGRVGATGLNGGDHLHLALYQGVTRIARNPVVFVQYMTAGVGTPYAADFALVTAPAKPLAALYTGNYALTAVPVPWTRRNVASDPACVAGAVDTTVAINGSNVYEIEDANSSCSRWFTRNHALDFNDDATMQWRLKVVASTQPGALVAGFVDGNKILYVGHTPSLVGFLFVDPSTGVENFLPGAFFLDASAFHTYRIVKNADVDAQLYVDDILVQTVPYSSLTTFSANYRQFFGARSRPEQSHSVWDYLFYIITPRP
ncbi:MAG: M23 family metallopeptidase [Acidobacteria bacterium]|nr:M23 family metallopeptidase [Acidobacteriota bacterium]